MKKFSIAESVTEAHPDKVCDQIADTILDACLKEDPNTHVACEVLETKGTVLLAGEISSSYEPDALGLAESVVERIGYDPKDFLFDDLIHRQSPDIAQGVQTSREKRGNPAAEEAWRGTNGIPSWSWQGCDGNKAVVEVYTDAETVELLLNGKGLGRKKGKNCRAVFKTRYAPGRLEAVACDVCGKEVSRSHLDSAVGQTMVSVVPEVKGAKCGDVVYVDISITGENGVIESNADRRLKVSVSGGELLAFGSANPRTEERFDEGSYTTYYGKALVAVRMGGEHHAYRYRQNTVHDSNTLILSIQHS